MANHTVFSDLDRELAQWDRLQPSSVHTNNHEVQKLKREIEQYRRGPWTKVTQTQSVDPSTPIPRPRPASAPVLELPVPPVSKAALIGIIVAVVVVVAVVIVVVVYFTVIHTSNADHGLLSAFDATNRTSGPFHPGDVLVLTYLPDPQGVKITPGQWAMSVDRGATFPYRIPFVSNSGHFSTQYTLPADVYSNQVVFRAYDVSNANTYVDSILVYTIEPPFRIDYGAGTRLNQLVYPSFNLVTGLSYDTNVLTLEASTVRVQMSTTANFAVTLEQDVVSFEATTQKITWKLTADTPTGAYFLRVLTTGQIGASVTEPLVAIAPYPVTVSTLACSSNAATFDICAVTMLGGDGTAGHFFAGEPVYLVFSFTGTFPGSATWTYDTGNGTNVPITPAEGPTATSSTVTYGWTLPTGLTSSTFTVTATSGASTGKSFNFVVEALSLTWDAPLGRSQVAVFPGTDNTGAQQLKIVQTLVTLSVPYSDTMQFFIALTDHLTDTPSYFSPYFVGPPASRLSENQAVIQWSVTQTQVGNGGTANKIWWLKLVDEDQTVVVNTGVQPVNFVASAWSATAGPIFNLYQDNFCFNATTVQFEGVSVNNCVTPEWLRTDLPVPPWPQPYTGARDVYYCNLQPDGTQSILRLSPSATPTLAWTYTPTSVTGASQALLTLSAYNSTNSNQRFTLTSPRPITEGLAQGGTRGSTTSTVMLASASQLPEDNAYTGYGLVFVAGPGADTGLAFLVLSYVSSTNTVTVQGDLEFNPTTTSTYRLVTNGTVLTHVLGGEVVIPWLEKCAPSTPYFSGNFHTNQFPGTSSCNGSSQSNGLSNYRFTMSQAYQI